MRDFLLTVLNLNILESHFHPLHIKHCGIYGTTVPLKLILGSLNDFNQGEFFKAI